MGSIQGVRRQRRDKELWQVHEVEVLMAAVLAERGQGQGQQTSASGGTTTPAAAPPRINFKQLMSQLGWDQRDSCRADLHRLQWKVNELRVKLDNGVELTSERRRADRTRGVHWTAWCENAFMQLASHEGTSDDLCAVMQADPQIAPMLDHRVDATHRTMPRWRKLVASTIPKVLGVTKTGEKRGRLYVYRYDPEAAKLLAAAKHRKRAPRGGGKGEASMPHLGKEQ